MATPVAIGLGSNLGERLAHLEKAVRGLEDLIEIRRGSAVYESRPMHQVDQPLILNACCVGETSLPARSLLDSLRRRFGPRELDLDLLLYGEDVIEEDELRVPHPRMTERPFVMWPLSEIAGDWVHPKAGLTVERLAAGLPRDGLRVYAPSTSWLEGA
ncbi:MAG: 2-amino-4-hydroxy-6-hydroxymethyldihydropteridine diphosphokinase [Gemmatimonadales bacterium]